MSVPLETTIPLSAACPTSGTLHRFLMGQLDESEVDLVSRHLDGCELCRTLIDAFPADELLKALRQPAPCRIDAAPWRTIVKRLEELPKTLARTVAATSIPETLPLSLEPPQSSEELGRLGRYRLREQIGRGGMGIVYLAEDTRLQRTVALKTLRPEWLDLPEARQRFEREARALAKLDHPRVVKVLDVGEIENSAHGGAAVSVPFLTMPILVGESLGDRLRRLRKATPPDQAARLEPREVRRIGRQLAEALAAVHEVGLIHRDIKPDNVWLVAPNNDVVLLDFSVCRADEELPLTEHGAALGTPGYMSPQQINGGASSHDDLFALGLVLHQMATGVLPPRSSVMASDLPEELNDVIRRLLAVGSSDHFANAGEVVIALRSRTGLQRNRWAARWIACLLVMVAVVTVAGSVWRRLSSLGTVGPAASNGAQARSEAGTDDGLSSGRADAEVLDLSGSEIAAVTRSHAVCVSPTGQLLVVGDVTYDDQAPTEWRSSADVAIACFDTNRQPLWRHLLGGSGDDRAVGVAVDAHGNVIVIGWFSQTVDFDPDTPKTELTAAGLADAFVLKLSASGKFLWVRQFGGESEAFDKAHAVCVDAGGQITVVGSFAGTADFDPGQGESLATARGASDPFVVQLNADGELLWSRTFGADSNQEIESANGVAADRAGHVIVTGHIEGPTTFLRQPNRNAHFTQDRASDVASTTEDEVRLTPRGSGDAFVLKVDQVGTMQWAKSLGATGGSYELATTVATNAADNRIAIAGSFQGDDFDPGDSLPRAAHGAFDAFVTLFDADGHTLWTKTCGGRGDDRALAVTFDEAGRVHVAGFFNESVNFASDDEPKRLAVCRSPAQQFAGDGFVLSLSAEGRLSDVALAQGPAADAVTALTSHAQQGLIATGWFSSQAEVHAGHEPLRLTTRQPVSTFGLRIRSRD